MKLQEVNNQEKKESTYDIIMNDKNMTQKAKMMALYRASPTRRVPNMK